MQQLVVYVDDPADLISGYGASALIRVERDTSSTMATASEITTVLLVAGTTEYEYFDSTGSASHYYRTRYSKASPSVATDYSGYSDVFQSGAILAYAGIDDLRKVVQVPDNADNDFLFDCLVQASDLMDAKCERMEFGFYRVPQVSGTTTRTFTVDRRGSRRLYLELAAVPTSVSIASYTGATPVALATTDYVLEPAYPRTGMPYERLILSDQAAAWRSFPTGSAIVSVVGAFGFPAIPTLVQRGVVAAAAVFFRQGPNAGVPFGTSEEVIDQDPRLPRAFWDAVNTYRRYTFEYV